MNAFSLWVGLGAAVGLWRVARSVPQRQIGTWVNAGLFVLFLTLVGARLFYVWINWGYFAAHLAEAIEIWLGGLEWTGAVAGASLAMLFLSFQFRAARNRLSPHSAPIPLGWLSDRLYPLLPPLAITIWLGCWQTGVAYGAALPSGTFFGLLTLDENGVTGLHFPLQPLAALTLLAFFWVLETRVKPLRPAGKLSGLAVGGLLLHLLAASLLRADPAPYWHGLRMDTWFAIFYLAAFITLATVSSLVFRASRKSPFSHPEHSSS